MNLAESFQRRNCGLSEKVWTGQLCVLGASKHKPGSWTWPWCRNSYWKVSTFYAVCVCVCVCVRERERESECECACACERECVSASNCVNVCMCMCENETETMFTKPEWNFTSITWHYQKYQIEFKLNGFNFNYYPHLLIFTEQSQAKTPLLRVTLRWPFWPKKRTPSNPFQWILKKSPLISYGSVKSSTYFVWQENKLEQLLMLIMTVACNCPGVILMKESWIRMIYLQLMTNPVTNSLNNICPNGTIHIIHGILMGGGIEERTKKCHILNEWPQTD